MPSWNNFDYDARSRRRMFQFLLRYVLNIIDGRLDIKELLSS